MSCAPMAGSVRLGRLFNLPVASFPHLLRGDDELGGDLPPWDAMRLSELMPLQLTLTKDDSFRTGRRPSIRWHRIYYSH